VRLHAQYTMWNAAEFPRRRSRAVGAASGL